MMMMVGRLFWPCDVTERPVIIVVVVLVIGITAAAAFVVASTMGSSFPVDKFVAFNRMLGITLSFVFLVCAPFSDGFGYSLHGQR